MEKFAALVLLFSFTLSPISVLGQVTDERPLPVQSTQSGGVISIPLIDGGEADSGAPTQDQNVDTGGSVESDTDLTSPPLTDEPESLSEEPQLELEPEVAAMSSGSSATQAGAIFINNEVTRSEIPEVNTQTGALHYNYDLTVPPGRNEVTPDIRLTYDSNNTDNSSIYGYGWSVSIPHIKRVNKLGSNELYASSTTFTSSLDGELVQVGTTTTYRPRVENGDFREYIFSQNSWIVLGKDGTRLSVGSTSASRRDNPLNSAQVYSWHLDEMRDSNDNYIEFAYYKDAGEIYPSTITYTGNGSTDGIFTVTFTRETRPDALVSASAGFTATTTHRISRIESSINGSWVGRYDLAYTLGHNGNRSLLSSITGSGRDDAGAVTVLPATNFTYETYTGSDKEWSEDTNWIVPVNISREERGYDDGVRFVDINGDSRVDIIKSAFTTFNPNVSSNLQQEVLLNTGTGWATSTAWTLPEPLDGRFGLAGGYIEYSGQGSMDMGARFADVNKDGFVDILWSYSTAGSYAPAIVYNYNIKEIYINNGVDGWATSSVWTMPSDIEFGRDATDAGGRIADINGDGLPDLLSSVGSTTRAVYLNTGSGWKSATSTWSIPEPFVTGLVPEGTEIVDVNGDGLADIYRSFESDRVRNGRPDVHKIYLNTGSGWSLSNWTPPLILAYQNSDSGAVYRTSGRLADINGDNLPDLISSASGNNTVPEPNTVYINTGEGWTVDSVWSGHPVFKFGYIENGFHYAEAGTAQMDVDGDNLIDFVRSGPSGSSPFTHTKGVFMHQGKVPDLLSEVEYAEGGIVSVEYEQSSRYGITSTSTNPNFPFNLNTVNTVSFDDGVSPAYTHTYTYGGGELYYASSTDTQPAGFATTTKQDSRGNKEYTYISQGNGTNSAQGEFADAFEKIGKTYLTEKYENADNLYARTSYKWESQDVASTSMFVYKTQEITQQYDGNTTHKDTAISYTYDAYGNPLLVHEWGEVNSSSIGTFNDTGTDKRTTEYQYATSTSPYRVTVPSQIFVTDQSSAKVRESKYYYDNQSLNTVIKGNRTKQEEWIDGSSYATRSWSYNSYGLPTQYVEPRFATTTYAYDAYSLYPILTTNALGHTASSTYDYSAGKAVLTTDSSGRNYQWILDGLDRVLTELQPDPSSGSTVATKSNTYTDTRNSVAILTTNYLSASTTVPSHQYFDGFGRKIQEKSRAEAEDTYVTQDWVYGREALLVRQSLPYFKTGSTSSNATTTRHLLTHFVHDPLNRVTEIGTIVGTTSTVYDQWQETVTDPKGKFKTYSYDAYKRLSGVDEHNGGSTYSTTYQWDQNNQITNITDALGNVRGFTYDGLGRRITAQDLHAPADSTYGTWSYQYDDSGNQTQITDPKAQVVQNTYDLLNRKLTENYTGQAGTEVVFTYDTCTDGVGKLCIASSTAAVTNYTYTPNGRVDSEVRTILGTSYTTAYDYDRQGNTTQITYPDSSIARHTFNAAGLLESVEQKESGGTFNPVVTDFDYAPTKQVSYQQNANCTYVENTYNPKELYRLQRKLIGYSDCEGESLMSGEGEMLARQATGPEVDPVGYFTALGENASDTLSAEAAAVQEDLLQFNNIGTTTPLIALQKSTPIEEPLSATSTDAVSLARPEKPNRSDQDLVLKAPSAKHLGTKQINGIVRYAYRTDTLVDDIPVALSTSNQAQKAGVAIGEEYVEKRTKYSRTFSTDKPGVHVLEVVSGDPRYFKDENGVWWLAEYGETTKELFDKQVAEEKYGKQSKRSAVGDVVSTLLNVFTIQKAYAVSSTFYPDPNTEVTSVDGEMYKDNSTNWTTVRNASASNWGSDSNSGLGVLDQKGNGNGSSHYGIRRAFLLFDTSAIPDAAVISTTTLDIYVTDVIAGGSEKRIYVVSSSPSSNTAITTGDYDAVGGVSYGSSDGIYIINSYESIPLNSSGLAAVSKTGVSKFALRTHNDLNNITPTDSIELNIGFSASETSGTNQDPKLVVVYNSTPSAATALEAGGQTNPTGLADRSPSLTSVYVDPDPTDQAVSYQIQVSTSNTDWSAPVWDSGKQTLPFGNVGNGYRSPDIEYAGTGLVPNTTYYWRMKYWDLTDAAGAWSTTTASFSVALPETSILDNLYEYDEVGNIATIVDIRNVEAPIAQVFTYDDLHRLTSVATTSATLATLGQTITVQPDAATGKDTHWGDTYITGGGPNDTIMRIGGWSDNYYSYIQFSLGSIPNAADIEYAQLHLFNTKTNAANDAKIQRITQSWTESGVTSSNNPSATDIGMAWQSVPGNDWWIVDATDLVKSWKDGTYSNNGVLITGRYNSGTDYTKDFVTSDNTDATKWPKLVVKQLGESSAPPVFTLGTTTSTTSTYTYNAIGNMTSQSGVGTYTYVGTGYTNPHAVISIGPTSYAYDANGNLTGYASTTLTWDYQNRLTTLTAPATTASYAYDHTLNRVAKTVNGTTTRYPNTLYDSTGTSSTKHLYAHNFLIASIYGASTTATTTYAHLDHLDSTVAVTGSEGQLLQTTTYRPYGAEESNTASTTLENFNRYIGQEYDEESSLSYLNARYYEGSRGQFLSQDPVFLGIGVDKRTEEALRDPQLMNSYSYGRNNPITNKDPNGEWVHIAIGAGAGIVGQYGYDVYNNIQNNGLNAQSFTNVSSAGTYATRAAQGAIIAASGGLAAGAGIGLAGQAATVGVTSGAAGVGANMLLGQSSTVGSVATDVVVGSLTYGLASSIPKVPGRLPNFGTKAFMQGAHTQRNAVDLGIDASASYLANIVADLSKTLKELQKTQSQSSQGSNSRNRDRN